MEQLLQTTPSTDLSTPSQTDARLLEYYRILRGQIEHEDNLVGSRISWFVTSQSFLFSAYAIIATAFQSSTTTQSALDAKHLLLVIIPSIAISASVLILMSILSGIRAMTALRIRYVHLIARWEDPMLPPIQGNRLNRMIGMAAPTLLPPLFTAVWAYLLLRKLF
jgi:hypothetical protein